MSLRAAFLNLTKRVEVITLVVIVVIGGALWAFVALAAEMIEGDLHAFDQAVLLALRTPGDLNNPIGGSQVEVAMRDLTALGGVTVLTLISLSVLVFLVLNRQRASAVFLGIAIIGGQALSHLAKLGFSRPRPDLVPHGVEVATASFPSGHSMMAAVTYLTLAVMLARSETQLGIRAFYITVAAVLAMLVGISRVYLGVHWPSDVLAGWTLGAAWALGVWLLARRMGRHGQIEPDKRGDT
ncbi:PAP2 family protein [Pseudooceanicola sediminis]|mgnify:CR=1 FL=1|uniref:PAP2 family protein n=1 Tax=Pseudooceanicola sediminis TaxID=2211117 RepID=A0A399J937_9RHOB|nr:phosphatase PAP2 family protein [Pseudooceanicola sediminis]KAA2317121.1 phosphatase PAP2 family protein [Puniceibacterium sp. HSS470]RII40532.1 PAP2 family protein [Pseudooceanicola sediminis]|tara:strand:- start:135669 stop:136388 length:720 start_codon:yes stop_codon:yes gene_type:complete